MRRHWALALPWLALLSPDFAARKPKIRRPQPLAPRSGAVPEPQEEPTEPLRPSDEAKSGWQRLKSEPFRMVLGSKRPAPGGVRAFEAARGPD